MTVYNTSRNGSDCSCEMTVQLNTAYLFDVVQDPTESRDRSQDNPQILHALKERLRVHYDASHGKPGPRLIFFLPFSEVFLNSPPGCRLKRESAWRPEQQTSAYEQWNTAELYIVPWTGNVTWTTTTA